MWCHGIVSTHSPRHTRWTLKHASCQVNFGDIYIAMSSDIADVSVALSSETVVSCEGSQQRHRDVHLAMPSGIAPASRPLSPHAPATTSGSSLLYWCFAVTVKNGFCHTADSIILYKYLYISLWSYTFYICFIYKFGYSRFKFLYIINLFIT